MYQKIYNPITQKNVPIYSNLCKYIINNYLQSGGAGPGAIFPPPALPHYFFQENYPHPRQLFNDDEDHFMFINNIKNYTEGMPEPYKSLRYCRDTFRYCGSTQKTAKFCKRSNEIIRFRENCKRFKVLSIVNLRPEQFTGRMLQILGPNILKPFRPQNPAVPNQWVLCPKLSIPESLHGVADDLEIPKYIYVSRNGGYVIQLNENVNVNLLPDRHTHYSQEELQNANVLDLSNRYNLPSNLSIRDRRYISHRIGPIGGLIEPGDFSENVTYDQWFQNENTLRQTYGL